MRMSRPTATATGGTHHAQDCPWRRTVLPFAVVGFLAILVGGLIAATIAHEPSRNLVWLVAYLVLIFGLAQIFFGIGQAWLKPKASGRLLVWSEFALLNIGNLGIIYGVLADNIAVVAVATVLFLAALGLFALTVHRQPRTRFWQGYHVILALVAVSALIGLGLAAFGQII